MHYSTRDLQARLAALGFPPGPIDGMRGERTRKAAALAMAERGVRSEADLFHPSGLHRIHMHWTAGEEGVIALEREHYHFVIDKAGAVVAGLYAPEANAAPIIGDEYAAHTRKANSGAIGVAIDAMAGARECPFDWGTEPINPAQIDALAGVCADLCLKNDIPVSRYSVLTHAEVQPTLGIRQHRKWDITVLPGMSAPGDPTEVGDRLRERIRAKVEAPATAFAA